MESRPESASKFNRSCCKSPRINSDIARMGASSSQVEARIIGLGPSSHTNSTTSSRQNITPGLGPTGTRRGGQARNGFAAQRAGIRPPAIPKRGVRNELPAPDDPRLSGFETHCLSPKSPRRSGSRLFRLESRVPRVRVVVASGASSTREPARIVAQSERGAPGLKPTSNEPRVQTVRGTRANAKFKGVPDSRQPANSDSNSSVVPEIATKVAAIRVQSPSNRLGSIFQVELRRSRPRPRTRPAKFKLKQISIN